jgi:hypothetical protein
MCCTALQSHAAKAAALESSLKQQSDALADLAATLADLPGKGGLLEVRMLLLLLLLLLLV